MRFDVDEVQTTLVRLELEVEGNVEFVKNIAKGQIAQFTLLGDNFEAMKGEAQAIIKVENTDLISGSFRIEMRAGE